MCASANKRFSPPTNRQRAIALGDTNQVKPKGGDWVTINEEQGQTVQEFEQTERAVVHSTHKIIYLQPIGSFDHSR
ncbi:unnamed protein product [Rotaria magnacalcarata]